MKPLTGRVVLLALASSFGGALVVGCSSSSSGDALDVMPTAAEQPATDLAPSDLGEGDSDPDIDGDDAIGDSNSPGAGMSSADGGTSADGGADDASTDDGGEDGSADDGDDGGSVDDDDGGDPDATDPDGDSDPYAGGAAVATTITSGAKSPHNVGFGGRWRANKVGAWVLATNICDATPMYYEPTMASAIVKNAHGQDVHLAKSRAVVVQMAPGLHDGYVWVEPDLSSVTAAREKVTFGQSLDSPTPYIGARGWVRSDCLRPGKDKGIFPTKHVLNPAGDSVSVIGTVTTMQLKTNNAGTAVACDVRARYSHSSAAGYANYANRNAYSKGVYINFNTPSALYKGIVRGGGVTSGYLTIADTFNVVAKVDDKAVQKNHTKNPSGALAINFPKVNGTADKGADDQHPGEWAYGYVDQASTRTWGFVYYDCLTAAADDSDPTSDSTPTPAPSTSSDSCAGKSDGEYCGSLSGQSYICSSGQIAGGNSCPPGELCVSDDSGMKLTCE